MKKISTTIILSVLIYILSTSTSSAALLLMTPDSACTTTACKEASAEAERLRQEKIATQEREEKIVAEQAEKLRQEQIEAQAEKDRLTFQKEADIIQKEKEYKLKIKELEDRINKLETQQTTTKTIVPVKDTQVQVAPAISNKKAIQPTIIKKEEPKEEPVSESIVSGPSPVVELIPTSIQKVSWFKRFLNWFK